MKTKKYLFLMLAAALFAACGDDDDDNPNPTPEQPSVIEFADYADVIDQNYSTVLRQYGEPSMAFGDFYVYENLNDGKVSTLSLIVNPANQQVYTIMEMLAEDAYKAEDIADYFASKYTTYSKEPVDVWDEDYENVIGTTYAYTFGNADNQEDATLVIEVTGNQSVSYYNPKNMPAEPSGSSSLEDMTPNEAVISFLLHDVEDILDEYPGVFTPAGDMYMTFMEENPYLAGIAFTPVDGFITTIILLYNEELTDEDIIAYYEELGYMATKTGYDEEEETDIYTITNGAVLITYSAGRAEITFLDED